MPTKPLTLQQRRGAEPQAQRPTAAQRGYDYRWQKYRRVFMMQPENALCAECRREPATHVDHKVPVSGRDDPLFWEPSNHQGLCAACHSAKTAREDGGYGNPRAVRS